MQGVFGALYNMKYPILYRMSSRSPRQTGRFRPVRRDFGRRQRPQRQTVIACQRRPAPARAAAQFGPPHAAGTRPQQPALMRLDPPEQPHDAVEIVNRVRCRAGAGLAACLADREPASPDHLRLGASHPGRQRSGIARQARQRVDGAFEPGRHSARIGTLFRVRNRVSRGYGRHGGLLFHVALSVRRKFPIISVLTRRGASWPWPGQAGFRRLPVL